MENEIEISEKEKERRRKISEYRKKVIAEKRKNGLDEYRKKKRKEKEIAEKKKQHEKEKKKKKKAKEAEKKKHKRPVGRPKKRGPKKKKYSNASNSKKFYLFNRYSCDGINCKNEEIIYPIDKLKLIEENMPHDGDETFSGYIYKYTFPNGKIYIGQTTQSVEKRFQSHVRGSKSTRPQRCDVAIKKYGPENIIIETIESLTCNNLELLTDALDALETYYIMLYKSNFVEYGYNSTIGGKGQLSRYIKLDKEILKKVWEKIKNPDRNTNRKMPPFTYVIISCKNRNQNKFIGKYRNENDAYDTFNELKENSENPIFPVCVSGNNKLVESIDEYMLLHLFYENNDENITYYNKNNSNNYEIIDSFRYYKEETFWVWGYDNKSDRKTFMWVFENIVLKDISPTCVNETYKNILTYHNKIIIKSNTGKTDIVFCKNVTDAKKFYDLLAEYIKKDGINFVKFIGDFSKFSKERKELEKELMNITGLPKRKIQMKANSFFMKN